VSGKQSAPSNDHAAHIGIRADELLRDLVDCLPDSMFAKSATGEFLWANKRAAELLGANSPLALVGKTDFDFYPHEKAAQIREREQLVVRTGRTLEGPAEAIADRVTGKIHWRRTTTAPLTDKAGQVVGIVGVTRDVSAQELASVAPASGSEQERERTERKELESALERERGLLRTMIDLIPAKIYAKDAQGRFLACNKLVAREMGTTPEAVIGKTDFDFFPAAMAEGFFADERAIIKSGQPLIDREELVLDRPSGSVRSISTSKLPVRDSAGHLVGIVGIGRDITESKLAEARIRHLATHDSLTNLPNRAMFAEQLDASIRDAAGNNNRFAVLFIDLDHFKAINDTLGHDAGDALLKQTAARLRESVRPGEIVARLGGDEFVVLCRDAVDLADIDALASRILQSVIRPVRLLDQECRISASIGVAIFPGDGDTERTLMKSADSAMYTAKQDGKNNYRFASRLRAESLERLMLENELRRAIERKELLVHYLAKFDLKSRTITGAQALLRWHHPDLGIIAPSKFLPLAEETGLIIPIGSWVLKTVCAQHVAWRREGFPALCMSINLTARQFTDEHLVRSILSALDESGMAANMLELEFSEGLLMQDSDRTARVLGELKRAGVRLTIDNFGASYLSLANIQKFPIDTLKVDRSLLRDIDQNVESRAMTEAIIAVGKSLSLAVIAEGVETRRQAAFALEHACDAMQGFFVSEPAAAEQFSDLLRLQAKISPDK
jgi:diguanylate cyclase (GGDEF)-like protein/PAS domain S-box-containing protein